MILILSDGIAFANIPKCQNFKNYQICNKMEGQVPIPQKL
jgi:hypothetical protein